MNANETQTVQPMQKVKVDLIHMDANQTLSREFIFGLGTEGLTPFEYQLAGKGVGDQMDVLLSSNNSADYFGHLFSCETLQGVSEKAHTLRIKVKRISAATSREIVSAMAQTSPSGCGGGCGCGCS